jgi:hypothetical protein
MSMPDEEYDTWVHGFDESPDVVVTQLTDERLEGGLATLYETDSEDFE